MACLIILAEFLAGLFMFWWGHVLAGFFLLSAISRLILVRF